MKKCNGIDISNKIKLPNLDNLLIKIMRHYAQRARMMDQKSYGQCSHKADDTVRETNQTTLTLTIGHKDTHCNDIT